MMVMRAFALVIASLALVATNVSAADNNSYPTLLNEFSDPDSSFYSETYVIVSLDDTQLALAFQWEEWDMGPEVDLRNLTATKWVSQREEESANNWARSTYESLRGDAIMSAAGILSVTHLSAIEKRDLIDDVLSRYPETLSLENYGEAMSEVSEKVAEMFYEFSSPSKRGPPTPQCFYTKAKKNGVVMLSLKKCGAPPSYDFANGNSNWEYTGQMADYFFENGDTNCPSGTTCCGTGVSCTGFTYVDSCNSVFAQVDCEQSYYYSGETGDDTVKIYACVWDDGLDFLGNRHGKKKGCSKRDVGEALRGFFAKSYHYCSDFHTEGTVNCRINKIDPPAYSEGPFCLSPSPAITLPTSTIFSSTLSVPDIPPCGKIYYDIEIDLDEIDPTSTIVELRSPTGVESTIYREDCSTVPYIHYLLSSDTEEHSLDPFVCGPGGNQNSVTLNIVIDQSTINGPLSPLSTTTDSASGDWTLEVFAPRTSGVAQLVEWCIAFRCHA